MRLLFVEDNQNLAIPLVDELAEEYAVDWSTTAAEALYRGQVNSYDLAVIDIGLPDGDGISLCRKLRNLGCSFPVLILTAQHATDQKVAALDSGADDYLEKPFHLEELRARIRVLLRRKRQSSGTLQFHDLWLDCRNRVAIRAGTQIELRRKEFDLLELFVRHPGQIISRKQLLEDIWQQYQDPASNLITVHMNYLREKIDRPFTSPLIHTVTGEGYCLKLPD